MVERDAASAGSSLLDRRLRSCCHFPRIMIDAYVARNGRVVVGGTQPVPMAVSRRLRP